MSAAAQVLDNRTIANRENSLHSTGPVTAAGKAKSSMNAFRHGLTSKHIVLPGEDAEEYEALREDTIKTFEPANATELVLAEEVSAASWRLLRVRAQETAILPKLLGDKAGLHVEFATPVRRETKGGGAAPPLHHHNRASLLPRPQQA